MHRSQLILGLVVLGLMIANGSCGYGAIGTASLTPSVIVVTATPNPATQTPFVVTATAFPQIATPIPGSLRVWLRDRDTGAFVSSASVSINGPSRRSGNSESLGQVYFGILPPGVYTITVSATNYASSAPEQVALGPGDAISHTLYMAILQPTVPRPSATVLVPTAIAIKQPSPSIAPIYDSVVLLDPPDGRTFSANNTVLRWKVGQALQSNEGFEVYVWLDGNGESPFVANTQKTTLEIDFLSWKYAGQFAKFLWTVRIKRADGTFLSNTAVPFAFLRTEKPPAPTPVWPPPVVKPYPEPPGSSIPDRKNIENEVRRTSPLLLLFAISCFAMLLVRMTAKRCKLSDREIHRQTGS